MVTWSCRSKPSFLVTQVSWVVLFNVDNLTCCRKTKCNRRRWQQCPRCMNNAKPTLAYWERLTDELRGKDWKKRRKQHADTQRESEKREKRRVVTDLDLHVHSTALTVAQASSIRQADSNETSSTPSRTLLSSFNHACSDSLLFALFIK